MSPFILLIHDVSSDVESIRQMLPAQEGFRLQCVTRLATALARIAGGGVDAIILDPPPAGRTEAETLEQLLTLREKAPLAPVIAICDSDKDTQFSLANGATASLTLDQCTRDLKPLVWRLTDRRKPQAGDPRKRGMIITVLGSKGGVGVTTVALNVAYALAQKHRVILTELRPAIGTLSQYFRTYERAPSLANLLVTEPDAIGASEIDACLSLCRRMPGLRFLFGPQATASYQPIGFDHAAAIAAGLKTLADYVVIDLPPMPSDANRAVIQASDCLALVVERDPVSMESARLMIQTITSWGPVPPSMGTVIVNRTPVGTPVPLGEFEERLGLPVFAVIPPAPDECIAAQRAQCPLVAFDSDGLAAASLIALARVLNQTAPLQFERQTATL
jgi:pilus assembly protein CpaE